MPTVEQLPGPNLLRWAPLLYVDLSTGKVQVLWRHAYLRLEDSVGG